MLPVHNSERDAMNASVPPLVWIDKLAADAKTWADHLVVTGVIVHCGATPGCDTREEGENAWVTGASNQNQTEQTQMLEGPVSEKKNYNGGVLTPENWYPTGHYTQMIWKSIAQVGC